jgi:hypothetical protein
METLFATIAEASRVGAEIAQIHIRDDDNLDGTAFHYTLLGDNANAIRIEQIVRKSSLSFVVTFTI